MPFVAASGPLPTPEAAQAFAQRIASQGAQNVTIKAEPGGGFTVLHEVIQVMPGQTAVHVPGQMQASEKAAIELREREIADRLAMRSAMGGRDHRAASREDRIAAGILAPDAP